MERAEKSTQSAHSGTAAGPSRSNASPVADHRPAAAAQRALAGWVAQREPIQRAGSEEDLQMKMDLVQREALDEGDADEIEMRKEIFNDPDLSAEDRRVFGALYDDSASPLAKITAQARQHMFREVSWPRIKAERRERKLKTEEEAGTE